jgi:serine protease Do
MHPATLAVTCLVGWAAAGDQGGLRETPMVRAIKRARPSTVNIHSQKSAPGAAYNRMSGMGTGVVVDERGYVITNYHVIEDVSTIRCSLLDGTTMPARVIGRDPTTDLALLKIDPKEALAVMPLGTSADLMHGETVIAIGNAFGYEHTVTSGIISELHRDVRLSAEQAYYNLIQTDASINPGNSGGPLINIDGEMIGLNVAIRAGAQGIGFAIPADEVKKVLARLMSVKALKSAWHGVVAEPTTDGAQAEGRLIVRDVEPNSPAARVGLVPGDRILQVGRYDVREAHDLERALLDRRPGEEVEMRILREGRHTSIAMALASLRNGRTATASPAAPSAADMVFQKLGLKFSGRVFDHEVRKASSQLEGGLRITDVAPSGSAWAAGIRPGDILVGLDEYSTVKVENILFVLTQPEVLRKDQVLFYVLRDGQIFKGKLRVRSE